METGKILSADVLDIIFDARNKDYGAYDLRKNYQRRLLKSLLTTCLVVSMVLITYLLLGSMKPGAGNLVIDRTIELEKVPQDKPAEKIVPPPVKTIEQQAIKIIQFTKPLIVTVDPPANERPPEQSTLETANIGTVNQDGKEFDGIQGPPVSEAKAIVDVPQQHFDDKGLYETVEIESTYPGGMSAWGAFLYHNLVYPQQAIDIEAQGTVYVQFIVDAQGNVSDVTVLSGPEELRAAAVNVIKKSGRWNPGIQNGHKVKSYKRQPITFKLAAE